MGWTEWRTPPWVYPFFGLPDNYQVQLHSILFDLAYYGKIGGFSVAYEMPVQYRTFYYKKLISVNEKEKREYDKNSGSTEASSVKPMARGPSINNR